MIEQVITLEEACKRYKVKKSLVLELLVSGELQRNEARKTGNVWLLDRNALERTLRINNKLGKSFCIEDISFVAENLGFEFDGVEIWYENNTVRDFIDNMPYSNLIPDIFRMLKQDLELDIETIVIDENLEEVENLYSKENKVWMLTLGTLVESIYSTSRDENSEKHKSIDSYVELYKLNEAFSSN